MPAHDLEIDRLNIQHYAYLMALSTNYLAPVRAPSPILASEREAVSGPST